MGRKPKSSYLKHVKEDKEVHIQAALNAIPIAGSALATYFGEYRTERVKERMFKLFDEFSDRINKLERKKIDYEYIKSEEFAELFLQTAEQAARSAAEKRIRRFANILANNILLDSKMRQRTLSYISVVDRLSDLDTFVLLCYGPPDETSMRADTKDNVHRFMVQLAGFLDIDIPPKIDVIESVLYMDNLGLTWVNEKIQKKGARRGPATILKEFSSFRSPLGDEVVKAIIPLNFFMPKNERDKERGWPEGIINSKFKDELFF